MGIAARIQQNRIIRKPHFMELVDDFAFDIALEIVQVDLRKHRPQLGKIVLKGPAAVDFGLALAQQVEVGAVDDDDFQGNGWEWLRSSKLRKDFFFYFPDLRFKFQNQRQHVPMDFTPEAISAPPQIGKIAQRKFHPGLYSGHREAQPLHGVEFPRCASYDCETRTPALFRQ